MSRLRNQRDEARLVRILREAPYAPQSEARSEFERRRLMARLAAEQTPERGRVVVWQRPLVRFGALAAAAAAVICLAVLGAQLAPWSSRPTEVSGRWDMARGNGLEPGHTVLVPPGAKAELVLPDGTTLWLAESSRLTFNDSLGQRVTLGAGRLLASVRPRPVEQRFEVVTAHITVVVHGTVFAVVVGSEDSTVRLHEGRVRLEQSSGAVDMTPGQEVIVSDSGSRVLGPVSERNRLRDLALAGGAVVLESQRRAFATAGQSAGDQDALASMDRRDDVDPEAEASARAPSAQSDAANATLVRMKQLLAERRYDDVVAATATATEPTLLFYRGRALEGLGRFDEASLTYVAMSESAGDRQGEALYAAAKSAMRAGKLDAAVTFARRAADQGGPATEHALFIEVRALAKLGRFALAARFAEAYLAAHQGGLFVEDMLYLAALCHDEQDDTAKAKRLYQDYLQRFPQGGYVEPVRRALAE